MDYMHEKYNRSLATKLSGSISPINKITTDFRVWDTCERNHNRPLALKIANNLSIN